MSKKTIMVFDVPAEHSGALSILKDFYDDVKQDPEKDTNWIFVLSKPKLEETENIKILNFLWIKRSWVHRLFFDIFVAPKLVKNYNATKIFSLQNIIVPFVKVEQILYMHQSLPFSEYKFKIQENLIFWIYQNVIGKSIINSIKKADKVIVQTEWIKKACIERADISTEKIHVVYPKVEFEVTKKCSLLADKLTLFYPAGALEYKNHEVIIEACKLLKIGNVVDYEIIFTLDGNENKYARTLYEKAKSLDLPIKFVGKIERREVFRYYETSVLLFPSYIETFGLPLLEARIHNTPIIASDTKFGKEILKEYSNAYFFSFKDYEILSYIIKNFKDKKIEHCTERGFDSYKKVTLLEYLK